MPFIDSPLVEIRLPQLDVSHQLALDEILTAAVEEQGAQGRLWFWETDRPQVVIGRTNRIADEVHLEHCRADGVPVLRRCSGGGAVTIGRGCLSFALALPLLEKTGRPDVTKVTRAVMQRMAQALAPLVGAVEIHGVSDLTCDGRKFSGNSERWLRESFLHHGTILYNFDLPLIERYLRMPTRRPVYRADRPHADFVTNIAADAASIRDAIRRGWNVSEAFELPAAAVDEAGDLARSRYRNDTWTYRL